MEANGRGDVFDAVLFPEALGVSERGNTALGGDARAGEHQQASAVIDVKLGFQTPEPFSRFPAVPAGVSNQTPG